ncbi:uncharacterized protein HMPREF1541_03408 [Cyphellophora europaea CBS 101466]|uniref:T6SS Phospholipase effector Tle1-like catalytic domain-containing protein n=1 Tax=Cyphellophora europaea (strain CBS 101466) TaxID=1220924 RepID=W2RYG3_CYPE1|nr:uncharacterized protein HMPREF1541_03408 [Cyphellophora europaea CBS 101466]ETN41472.1 hypothetical protein HMPREF1541_03408 [Cyphellophora europaea CBS 101466]
MKLHRRHIYPLQMPASISNLRASPSPPSSPDREAIPDEKTSPIEHHKRDSPVGSVKTLRRTMYPLQSPASIVDLKNPATPQSKIPNDDAVDPNSGISTTLSGQSQILHSSKALRRHVYPLQSPASMADLNRPLTPQSLETKNDSRRGQSESTDNIESRPIAIERGAARRQGYPLQSPASTANLKRPAIELPSVTETNFAKTDKQRPVNTPEDQTADGPQSHRRHGYPLQSKASVPALHVSPASPSEDNLDPQGPAQVLSEQSRNEDLARKAVGLWRRQVYPLQSPENGPPFQRAPTPQPPEEESKKETNTGPIHLPKNIRAVKDSSSSEHNSGRTIIVCLDGTGDKFDNDNSNIVHLISALKKDDPRQVSYYQAGIGTYNKGGLNTGFSAALDMAVGSELGLHVRDAYHFLMHSYKEGDRICIFGFSRGAYTARCLAGMVHKVGLLPPRNIQQIPFAYEFYADDTREGWRQSRLFKAAFCIDINVYYLGCFDSVASVGFIPRRLPLSTTPTNKARYFRHAMALDERRAKFKVCRYETRDLDDILEPDSPQNQPPTSQDENSVSPRWAIDKKYGADYHPNVTDEEYEILREQEAPFETDVYEVWFAGCHSDVGGGAVANDERHKLAQIPLRWMIRQCFECDTGIIFKTKKLAEFGLDIHTLWPRYSRLPTPDHGPPPSFLEKYESNLPPKAIRRGKLVPIDRYDAQGERLYHLKSQTDEDWTPEQTEDFYDAMQDLNDQLEKSPRWWILEAWPVEYKVPVAPGKVVKVTGMNLGRYRGVDDYEPNLHWTAAHRERHRSYKINARTAPRTRWKIVA